MKYPTLLAAAAVLFTSALALPNPNPNPEAGPDANPQICYCNVGCYDTCGQPFCC
ncbi:hypothetical protein N657DRAFT_638477 [Parathielavia appendiculata]|uniref:Uncharacterized protein n=1 Tax=Parathielavia appendiculata TaxID=2587402 RepID=A0AAN6U7W7_9PEZI|nr:hypothetical protein N657DRAFT_638477 [Parathielavia appendiculata]